LSPLDYYCSVGRHGSPDRGRPFYIEEEGCDLKSVFGLMGVVLLLRPACAEVGCPVEVKILLASPVAQPAITSFGFKKETASLIYFFDTSSLDLLTQGVIVRVRQGANNDLTVKLRPPKSGRADSRSQLGAQFPCEIDRTRAASETSYAVGKQYNAAKVPEHGTDIYKQFSDSQKRLLHAAGVSIDWATVSRIATIHSTKWQTKTQSPYGKLALELWEWPVGKILELSAKAPPASDASKYAELERLLEKKGLLLNASQDTKTTTVLKTFATSRVLSW
jgi:hypothetical protein